MRSAGLKKKMKSCQIRDLPSKIFVISKVLTSKVDAVGNFDIVATRIWSKPAQKVNFLKSTWTSLCQIIYKVHTRRVYTRSEQLQLSPK